MKRQTISYFIPFLVGIACTLLVIVIVTSKSGNQALAPAAIPAPPPPVGPPGQPVAPPGPPEEGSPYLPKPLSFPKVLGGLLYYEKNLPDLALQPAQCRRLIPVLEGMGETWHASNQIEKELQKLLTVNQEKFIIANKRDIEKMSNINRTMAVFNKRYPGRAQMMNGKFFSFAMQLCLIRMEENVKKRREPLSNGEALITIFDIGTGVVWMDEDPELTISSEQAQQMLPIFVKLTASNEIVNTYFELLKAALTQPQLDAVGPNIKDITELKFKVFRENPGGPFNDPLINTVLELCRERATEKSKAK